MGHLYDTRKNAIEHQVEAGQKLSDIVLAHAGKGDVPADLTWQEIALFNWGTDDGAEVARALLERVGCEAPDEAWKSSAPEGLKLAPAFGPKTAKPVLVPRLWKPKGLAVNKQHTVKVLKKARPSIIGITELDKWFIPGHETCDVAYATGGDPKLADTVTFEVHGSSYGALDAWNKGLPTFKPLDVPVYSAKADGGTIDDWKGLSSCEAGALSPKDTPLNVAFSPYTVLLRHAKEGKHAGARIKLDPFWVAFDDKDAPVKASCKIAWKIDKATLEVGLLLIVDRAGAVVFAKGLDQSELDGGSYDWDGNDASGKAVVPAKMPYRVQLLAHTDIDTEDQIALAAMHTEVRLHVAKGTLAPDVKDYDPSKDVSSLDLSIADIYHKDEAPKDTAGVLWTKHQLAEAGFHPGPVTDATETDDYKRALHELQRSVPKAGSSAPSFARMTVEDDATEANKVLVSLDASRKRPWFGKPAEPGSTVTLAWHPGNWDDIKDASFLARLRDPKKRMIVWIDDRNWYTDGSYWKYGFYDTTEVVKDANLDVIHNAPQDLGGKTAKGRGSFEDRDARVACDERDIARPWIPLQVDFRLLGKGQELDAEVDAHPPEVAEKVRRAIGPLRVDWTFDEIEKASTVVGVKENGANVTHALPELDWECNNLLVALGQPTGVRPKGSRTRMALRWALDKLKKAHDRKDVKRKSVYYNAPVDCGGIRPTSLDAYFKAAFGHGDGSLFPWSAAPDTTRESICTAVHALVGQPEEETFQKKRLGRAGVYFHPSRIAGDGYQVRAQVRFDEAGPYQCPNAKALGARYPRLPQAHSVQFRTWRKTSIRGYVQWSPDDDWSTTGASGLANTPKTGPDEWRAQYTACHVCVENELGVGNGLLKLRPSDLFATEDAYRDLVVSALDLLDPRRQRRGDITLANDYVWPWSGLADHGTAPERGADFNAAYRALNRKIMCDHVTFAIRLSLKIVEVIEAKKGRMRGHVLVQYQTTADCHFQQYECTSCGLFFTYAEHGASAVKDGMDCPDGCTSSLAHQGGYHHPPKRGSKTIEGVPSPSCGFPLGVFWAVTGDASLWAHEMGHNRHYEHAADAQQLPVFSARPEHDNSTNPLVSGLGDPPQNDGWDRACLMSYVSQKAHYDDVRDVPCFCFKCVLKNRGWKVGPLAACTPKGDLQDVVGV